MCRLSQAAGHGGCTPSLHRLGVPAGAPYMFACKLVARLATAVVSKRSVFIYIYYNCITHDHPLPNCFFCSKSAEAILD